MKKRNLKSLKLNKKKVSSLKNNQIKGKGLETFYIFSCVYDICC